MVRLMADPAFRLRQERARYTAHVRPINELVDELRATELGFVPYVAPIHGGVHARMLTLLRDPGPATREGVGSGFLSIENDDVSAERQATTFAQVGIEPSAFNPWNAYPWYINQKPTSAQLDLGIDALISVMALMPHVCVVMLQGGDAQAAWRRLSRRHPSVASIPNLTVIDAIHPSPQALRHPDPAVRQQRERRRFEDAHRAAILLRKRC